MIEIISLNKTFKSNKEDFVALEDINLTVNDGEIFGVIGLSGAGKSTLIRCINLLERPDSGKVVIDGQDLTLLNKKELNAFRKNLSMIFQGFNLFEQRTALQNVCFPLELTNVPKEERTKIALDLLEQMGIQDKANSYPSQLSGGQKQRVAIARALASNPKYLLCDEATSALDPEATESILSIIKEINQKQKITVIVITHELSVIAKICDRVAVIHNGKVCECNTPKQIFENPQTEPTKKLIASATIFKGE